jgi:glycosyltransferase involved in cell wall biosynthesis
VVECPVSVVIPAYNAAATLGRVLEALAEQEQPPREVIVVDDGSTDDTATIAERLGARLVATDHKGFAGGARNRGWSEARSDAVVFLDADAVPLVGWGASLARALRAYPGAVVGGARSFTARTSWGWVAHFQVETPYLPRGKPRRVSFVSSYCMVVPRKLDVRWDESYGGEDALFSADLHALGVALVFDPRIVAEHRHSRESFGDLRRQQQRLAYGLARCGPVQREGLHKRILSRVPVHYFLLVRLPLLYRRLKPFPALRRRFLRLLPHLVLAEWTLGVSACRYALRRPPLRGQGGADFR